MGAPGIYQRSVVAALSTTLLAGLSICTLDVLLALTRYKDDGVALGELLTISLGLYAWPVLFLGLVVGVIVGSWRATFGEGALRNGYGRLRDDAELDAKVSAGVIAAVVVGIVFAFVVAQLALALVANVQRKGVGAVLLGALVVAALPVAAISALPCYRGALRVTRYLPRHPFPSALLLLGVGSMIAATAVAIKLFGGLDWRALNLGLYALAGTFGLLIMLWWWLLYGPLTGLRQRVARRGKLALVAVAVAVALVLPIIPLSASPSETTVVLLTDYSTGARVWVSVGRRLIDRDGDGQSAFLGGPDCDDDDSDVYRGAVEIHGNGKDDNCFAGEEDAVEPKEKARRTKATITPSAVASRPGFVRPRNLLFIAIDTFRGDRLGSVGYRREGKTISPRLDELARRGTLFTRAYAQAPNTARSFPSMLSSQFPSQVAVDKQYENFPFVRAHNVLLFEVLAKAGMHTVGMSEHYYFSDTYNIRQGFAEWDNEGARAMERDAHVSAAPRIVAKAQAKLAQLASSKTRFAMFVHLFEPHSSYKHHSGFSVSDGTPVDYYDGEIAFVDSWVGKLIDSLAEHGVDENTMIVVASDHGEGFGSHWVAGERMYFHGKTLYEEIVRVPLIMYIPKTSARRITGPVMNIDVAPTIVEAFGIAKPPSFVGRSLLDAILGNKLVPRAAFAEMLPAPFWDRAAKMMVSEDGRYKFIYRESAGRYELYDLSKDRSERRNLARKPKYKPLVERFQSTLAKWMGRL